MVALILHGIVFFLFPAVRTPEIPDFQAPLYIALDPFPDSLMEQEEVPVTPPEPPPEEQPEEVITVPSSEADEIIESPTDSGGRAEEQPPVRSPASDALERPVPPVTRQPSLTREPPVTRRPPVTRQTQPSTQAPPPATTPPTPTGSALQRQTTPPTDTSPRSEQPAAPEIARIPDSTEPEATARPPEPAPRPTPPPQRIGRPEGAQTTQATSSQWLASQMEGITEIQEEYLEALEAWEEEQRVRAQIAGSDEGVTPDDETLQSRPRFADFQEALSRMIAGIESAGNVVRSAADGDVPGSSAISDGVRASPGIEGVTVGEGATQRRLVRGVSPDLSTVNLPPGFPPEYAVTINFTVGTDGVVTSARVGRPTPVPQLDSRLVDTVRSWRFEPATANRSEPVRGSVTIIVDTRSES